MLTRDKYGLPVIADSVGDSEGDSGVPSIHDKSAHYRKYPNAWRCKCDGPEAHIMIADSEDWPEPCCADCYRFR